MLSKAPQIVIKNAFLSYDDVVLFDHLNFSIQAGKCTCLLGPSGVGKTTLLRLIANLITDDEKTIFRGIINGHDNSPLTNLVSYMAQTDLLLPWLTALENTLLGYRLRGDLTDTILTRAKLLFKQVGLENAIDKYPATLSGGMKQRVALIRTLLEDKPIVLMDEPFSALDAITRFQLQNLATGLLHNKTVLVVTHDPMEALRIADEIIIMSGQPVTLKNISLTTSTPRNLNDKEVIQYQEILFEALLEAAQDNKS